MPNQMSVAEWIASLPDSERHKELDRIAPTEATATALLHDWHFWARPKQLPPTGDWRIWLLLAGRGFGKTLTIAQWARHNAYAMPGSRGNIVAATAADVRDVVVEGESGILAVHPDEERPIYEPSKRRLTWPNGTVATLYSADRPDRLRGPQCHWAIADELAAWRYDQEAWDMLMMGLRLGDDPRIAVATTPRPTKLIRQLVEDATVIVTSGTTYENVANLAPAYYDQVINRYEGTRLGRQELLAQLLTDVPGALWTQAMLEQNRVRQAPALVRIVVAVDPPASHGEDAAECGIVVAGIDENEHGYLLEDLSQQASPAEWGSIVVQAYDRWHADRIVAERNNGGDMVEHVIRTEARNLHQTNRRQSDIVSFSSVWASRGKHTRAEPVAAEYERHRIHHVGMFAELEDQMTSWLPGEESPDRLDAAVWAFSELMLKQSSMSDDELLGVFGWRERA